MYLNLDSLILFEGSRTHPWEIKALGHCASERVFGVKGAGRIITQDVCVRHYTGCVRASACLSVASVESRAEVATVFILDNTAWYTE